MELTSPELNLMKLSSLMKKGVNLLLLSLIVLYKIFLVNQIRYIFQNMKKAVTKDYKKLKSKG